MNAFEDYRSNFSCTEEEHAEVMRVLNKMGDDHHASKLARSILALEEQRDWLLSELLHYKPYKRMYDQAVQSSIAHNQDMIGKLFTAVADPEGVLAHGWRAMEEAKQPERNPM